MQYSQEHLKTMVYAEFGGQTECIMGNWKIENRVMIDRLYDTMWLWEYLTVWSQLFYNAVANVFAL